jgi:hypothetical protein
LMVLWSLLEDYIVFYGFNFFILALHVFGNRDPNQSGYFQNLVFFVRNNLMQPQYQQY